MYPTSSILKKISTYPFFHFFFPQKQQTHPLLFILLFFLQCTPFFNCSLLLQLKSSSRSHQGFQRKSLSSPPILHVVGTFQLHIHVVDFFSKEAFQNIHFKRKNSLFQKACSEMTIFTFGMAISKNVFWNTFFERKNRDSGIVIPK